MKPVLHGVEFIPTRNLVYRSILKSTKPCMNGTPLLAPRTSSLLAHSYKEDDKDELSVFWLALPNRGFGQKGKECKGSKKSKQRITVPVFITAAGMKENLWLYGNPRCLRFDKSALPVDYFCQKKAWMDGKIMETHLKRLNRRLSRSNCFIILMIDNAGCHPEDLKTKPMEGTNTLRTRVTGSEL